MKRVERALLLGSSCGLVVSSVFWGVSYYGVAFRMPHKPQHSAVALGFGALRWADLTRFDAPVMLSDPRSMRMVEVGTCRRFSTAWKPVFSRNKSGQLATWVFPLWIPFLVFSAIVTTLVGRRWNRKTCADLCSTCRYSLIGSTHRCPECGTPFEPRA